MDLVLTARTNTPLDVAFVCLRTLLLFSWGGDPWAQAIGGDRIQELVTDLPGAAVAGKTIEADQKESGVMRTVVSSAVGGYIMHGRPVGPYQLRVSKTGFKTCRRCYNRLVALTMRRNVERRERPPKDIGSLTTLQLLLAST